jgi:hypothetical protein
MSFSWAKTPNLAGVFTTLPLLVDAILKTEGKLACFPNMD